MELSVSSIVLSIVLVIVFGCVWKLLNWVYLRPKRLERCLREQGFIVNPYKILRGDTKEMISMLREARSKPMDSSSDDILPYLLPYHNHCSNLHVSRNYCIWLGPTPRLIISDPKLIREILLNYEDFRKARRSPLVNILVTGLLRQEGEEWAVHRNLLKQAFNLDKLKHMVVTMNSSCSELISKWDNLLMLSPKGSCELDVAPFMGKFSVDVISRTAFGSNYEEGKKIFQLQREEKNIVIQCMRSFHFPGSRFLPTKTNKRLKNIDKEIEAIVEHIISNKKKAMKEGKGTNDLLGILLETISEENQGRKKKKNFKMTIKDVIEECKLFYAAGQETTSVLIVWAMVLLSKHPKWQNLAREEVFAVFGDDHPNFDGLNQLKIVTMILLEVLRLYPPAIMISRGTHKKVKLGESVLPPGVEVELAILSIHHDPHIWGEDAKEFKPERFSEGITNATNVQGSFLAFSGGPRICLGQNFAWIEAKIALAMILRRYSFKLSSSYKHAPLFGVAIQPQHGAQLILEKI